MSSSSSFPRVLVALFLCGPVAEAQQPVARVRREQQLVLAEQPSLTDLQLRVAQGVTTVVRLDEDVRIVEAKLAGLADAVWVDVGSHSLVVEPLRPLSPGEQLPLELLLEQGETRIRFVLLLVSHSGEVDTQVNLELRPRSTRRLPAPAPEVPPPAVPEDEAPPPSEPSKEMVDLARATPARFKGKVHGTEVIARNVQHYRSSHDRFIAFRVYNPEGARTWSASDVVRLLPTGVALPGDSGWKVFMKAPIVQGRNELVVLKAPPGEPDVPVHLEVRETGGSRNVRLKETP